MKLLKDFVVKDNLFSEEFCEKIIGYCEKKNSWNSGTWYSNKNDKFTENSHKTFIIENSEIYKLFSKSIFDLILRYKKIYENCGVIRCTSIKINKYEVGDYMKNHVDHIHSIFDGKIKGIPILSFVGLLNSNYDGGEFILMNEKIKMKTGDVLVFPSCFLYPHEVKMVKGGVRYSWISWAS